MYLYFLFAGKNAERNIVPEKICKRVFEAAAELAYFIFVIGLGGASHQRDKPDVYLAIVVDLKVFHFEKGLIVHDTEIAGIVIPHYSSYLYKKVFFFRGEIRACLILVICFQYACCAEEVLRQNIVFIFLMVIYAPFKIIRQRMAINVEDADRI